MGDKHYFTGMAMDMAKCSRHLINSCLLKIILCNGLLKIIFCLVFTHTHTNNNMAIAGVATYQMQITYILFLFICLFFKPVLRKN